MTSEIHGTSSCKNTGGFRPAVLPAVLVLTALLQVSAVPLLDMDGDYAKATQTIGDLEYDLDAANHTASVVGHIYDGDSWDLEIPSSVEYGSEAYDVVSIWNGAFQNCQALQSVVIPDGIASIGEYAFCDCVSIPSVRLPASIASVGQHAFSFCTSLEAFTVDGDNTEYSSEDGVLFDKAGTKLIQYPNAKSDAYTVPDGVASIEKSAFEGCTTFRSVVIPEGVTYIGDFAFDSCALETVSLPKSITIINPSVFFECHSLRSVTIPDSVTSIKESAFGDCTSLETVSVPDSVASIGTQAFSCCTSLRTVSPGTNLKSIGQSAFDGCTSLESFAIPDSVTSLGQKAFYDCSALGTVSIGNKVSSLGNFVFQGCTSLETVTVPDSVQSIGQSAFYGCTSLRSVTISANATYIGDTAFSGCVSLTSIVIPKNINRIYTAVFEGCTSLGTIEVDKDNSKFSSQAGVLFDKQKKTLIQYPIGNTRAQYTLPSSVTSIGNFAFSGCAHLKHVVIPDSVESIGLEGFSGCAALLSVTFGKGVADLENYAFSGCTQLQSLTLPDGVGSIGDSTFSGCTQLQSVTIGKGVAAIGDRAFSGCTGLRSIAVDGDNAQYMSSDGVLFDKAGKVLIQYPNARGSSYTVPDGVETIEGYAFSDCTALESVVIPDSVTAVGADAFAGCSSLRAAAVGTGVESIGASAFRDCTSLTSFVIPDGVTAVGYDVFCGCTALESVVIPDSVTSIEERAFMGCTALSSVVIPEMVSSIGHNAFTGCTALSSVVIPDSVGSIGLEAFMGCTGMTDLTIPISLDPIQSNSFSVFSGCTNVLKVTFTAGTGQGFDYDSYRFSDSYYGLTPWCQSTQDRVEVVISDGVGSVGDYTLYGCTSVESVYYTGPVWNIVSIGTDAFSLGTLEKEVSCSVYSPNNCADGRLDAYGGDHTAFVYANLYTVSFDVRGHGDAPGPQFVRDGGRVGKPADPQQTGYTFGGWYLEPECTTAWNFASDTVTKDLVLYAGWVAERYTITVTVSEEGYGSVTPQTLVADYGSRISVSGNVMTIGTQRCTAVPAAATQQYTYAFGYWSETGGTVTGDMTITAVFTRTLNVYTVNVIQGDNGTVTGAGTHTFNYGSQISVSGNVMTVGTMAFTAAADGGTGTVTYAFYGWMYEGTASVPAAVTGDMTVTAVFSATVRPVTDDDGNSAIDAKGQGNSVIEAALDPSAKTVTVDADSYSVYVGDASGIQGKKIAVALMEIDNPSPKVEGTAYEFTFRSGDSPYTGKMEVTLPYTPVSGKTAAVYYVDGDRVESMPASYNGDGAVTFVTTHNSTYVVQSVDAPSSGIDTGFILAVCAVVAIMLAASAASMRTGKTR